MNREYWEKYLVKRLITKTSPSTQIMQNWKSIIVPACTWLLGYLGAELFRAFAPGSYANCDWKWPRKSTMFERMAMMYQTAMENHKRSVLITFGFWCRRYFLTIFPRFFQYGSYLAGILTSRVRWALKLPHSPLGLPSLSSAFALASLPSVNYIGPVLFIWMTLCKLLGNISLNRTWAHAA